jgi:alpha-mannosidase
MLEPFHAVRQMDSLCGSARHPYLIAGAFGKGWDNIHNYSYDLVWGLGRRTLPGTRLHLSNQVDFFRHFESLYGDSIPEVRVSHGNEWDLNPASLAEVSAQLRRSMEKLRTAEAMAALVTSGGDSLLRGLDRMKRDFLYGIGVYNLHGWTADGPVDRRAFAAYMRRQQRNVSDYVDALHLLAAEKLGEKIDPGPLDRVHFVFNSLSWERDGMVDVRTDGDFNAAQDLESGEILRGAVVEKDGATHLRIRVERVPPVGYRLIRLVRREGKGAPGPPDPFRFSRGRLETPHYRVRLSRSGAILSLADRAGGKEWAEGPLNDLGAARFENGEPVRVLERGAECITLLCRSDDPVRHECAVTFHARDPRVDFRNRILGNFSGPLHWTFAFNVDRPDVRHEEVGAVLLAKTESAGGHYADRMARTDYLTLNHFANAGNDRENVTLSNADCLFFRLGDSRPDFLDAGSSVLHVLAGGQVNENLGVFRQDGDTLFHQSFSLLPRSGPFDAGSAMRFSLEHQNPLFAGAATPGGEWAGPAHSFVRNDNPDVLLWALKPGEEGGLTMRWWNLESKPAASTVRLDRPIGRAVSASHVETDIAEIPCAGGAVPLDFAPQQIRTVRVPEY